MPTQVKGPKVYRNDPCPCGSGKKFKQCCAAEEVVEVSGSFFRVAMVLMAGAGVFLTVAIGRAMFSDVEGPKRVWSADHGHWHNVTGDPHGGSEGDEGNAGDDGSAEGGPGKVWSEEHGHYHSTGGGGGGSSTGGPGKVWNEAHGHYHNADPIERKTVRGNHLDQQRALEAERVRKSLSGEN